ncbi:hypothetical protein CR513_33126, partial [Mucuna pruriens]
MSPYRINIKLIGLSSNATWPMTKPENKGSSNSYENSRIYKEKVKQFHDQQILRKEFQVSQNVSSVLDGMDNLLSLKFFPMVQWN